MRTLLLALLPLMSACSPAYEVLYVGTYTGETSVSEGIYRYVLHASGRLESLGLAAAASNPSFLALSPDGRTILAVDEDEAGSVLSFRLDDGALDPAEHTLTPVSTSTSGGAHPCHLAVDAVGRVLVANYTGGNVGALRLGAGGELSGLRDTLAHDGEAGEVAHAHSVYFDGKAPRAYAVDLGTGDLFFMDLADRADRIVRPGTPPALALDSAAGPRHMAFHPNGLYAYVVNEYANTVTLLARETPGGASLARSSGFAKRASYRTLPEGFAGESFASHVALSRDGRFLYAANRGANTVAAFAVDEVAGGLTLVDQEPVRGDWPRHFALSGSGDFLVVANQRSGSLAVLRRDRDEGTLTYVGGMAAPTPACVLAVGR